MSIIGSQTEKNLLKAFAGESQARNRYTFFSKIAKKEGYEQIAALFLETAEQEKKHAQIFFNFLESGEALEITAMYPAGKVGNTAENLKAAAHGENEEWTIIYNNFSEVAKQEGFTKVSTAFKLIAKIEAEHEKKFLKLLQNIEEDKVFNSEKKERWMCRECGYIHEGNKALENCPVCDHPKAYFELHAENY